MTTFEITTDDLRIFLVHVTQPRKLWTWTIEERTGLGTTRFVQRNLFRGHRDPAKAFAEACERIWFRKDDEPSARLAGDGADG